MELYDDEPVDYKLDLAFPRAQPVSITGFCIPPISSSYTYLHVQNHVIDL